MFGIFNNLIQKTKKRLSQKGGMTLVEVILAFVVIAIVSTVLVRGTITAVNTLRINRSKTEALAIANEKIEILKAIDYSEILITEEDDEWINDYPQLAEDVYNVAYEVIWVNGEADSYKQLKVSVFGEYMTFPVDVITQLYPPVGEEATGGNIYPPPESLIIFSDEGSGESREIILNWEPPDTDKTILRYNIYRDGDFLGSSFIVSFLDNPGNDNVYSYYITAVYEGDFESVKSNTVSTGTPFVYPPPDNLVIVGYSGGSDAGRTVHLAWSAPDTELVITGYDIYRDDVYLDNTSDLDYQDLIGTSDHTYYIRTVYEEDNLSAPGNSVDTELILVYPPPENLIITDYNLGVPNRIVYLAWTAPITDLQLIEYKVFRDGIHIGSTTELVYENVIGDFGYTFYIKALYEIDNLSEASNSVEAQPKN